MSKIAELLAPAGSPEAVRAAVANGAGAVYLGFGDFNARRMAKNFTEQELFDACDFCHKRGVKVYVTLNTLVTDRELNEVERICRTINRAGVDAVIVADLGVARLVREVAPELPLHASTQMTVHDLGGVMHLHSCGFSRVVLSRELNGAEIAYICKNSPIEIEIFVHGALCMCYSGQCEMSAVIGSRSGNRGLCAQPCRLPYTLDESMHGTYPLSLKDLCLADYLNELSDMGVASLKIEGRMKRPEYVAIVTGIYSKLLRERRAPTPSERDALSQAFSRDGFTDGYFTGNIGASMFGVRGKGTDAPEALFASARETYANVPIPVKGVNFYCVIQEGRPSLLAAEDECGNRFIAKGPVPERAINRPLTEETVHEQISKTGGTRFGADSVKIILGENLSLPKSALNALRRECLDGLEAAYTQELARPEGKFNVGFKLINRKEPPVTTVSVLSMSQISDAMLERDPAILYIPLTEAVSDEARLRSICGRVSVCVSFPRIIKDSEQEEISRMAEIARGCGAEFASVGNIGHISLAEALGFRVRADFGINIFNSHALREVRRAGAVSALLSPELTFPQMRDISKVIDTEIFAYGRLPLMITENCVVRTTTGACVCKNNHALSDRTGAAFPLIPEFGHRNVILNSQKLFLADKKNDWKNLGITYSRLSFTKENAREAVSVMDAYSGLGEYKPSSYTRGLYYRGVE